MTNIVRRRTKPYYKRCAFTGYRPQKMPFGDNEADPRCLALKSRLREAIEALIGQGYAHFISGGAIGNDIFAAEAVLALKARYPWILLEMACPCPDQAKRWGADCRARHARLMAEADIVTVVCAEYNKGCMFRRNRYLVENADLMLAVFDGQAGGTAMTVDYARRMGVPVLRIPPDGCSVAAMVKKKRCRAFSLTNLRVCQCLEEDYGKLDSARNPERFPDQG